MKLSVIIPVYNEASTVLEIISQVRRVDVNMAKEIILIDGASTDGTREKIKKLENQPDIKIIYETKREGKGAAVRRGLVNATGDIVVIQDADLEVNPDEYPALLKDILSQEYQMVIGSRFLKDDAHFRFMSWLANKIVIAMTNLLYSARITDPLSCYKVFKREVLKNIELKCKGFDLDVELVVKMLKQGVRIKEIPIHYSPRTYGEGKKIRWKDGFIVLWTLIKYRFSK